MSNCLWVVWHPDGGEDGPDDGRWFHSATAEDAAKQWGQRHESDGCDYTLDIEPETVMVCPDDDHSRIEAFRVRAETSRYYYVDTVSLPLYKST